MRKFKFVLLVFIVVSVANYLLIAPQTAGAARPPGIEKRGEVPGKGKHKGWEQGKHKGWEKKKSKETKGMEMKEEKADKRGKGAQ